eukprot:1136763-Pelagomonas_calceolata.AAC.2
MDRTQLAQKRGTELQFPSFESSHPVFFSLKLSVPKTGFDLIRNSLRGMEFTCKLAISKLRFGEAPASSLDREP